MNISKTLIATALSVGMIGATATAFAHHAKAPQVIRSSQACDDYATDNTNWRTGHRGTALPLVASVLPLAA